MKTAVALCLFTRTGPEVEGPNFRQSFLLVRDTFLRERDTSAHGQGHVLQSENLYESGNATMDYVSSRF